jgi:hypothetical protein
LRLKAGNSILKIAGFDAPAQIWDGCLNFDTHITTLRYPFRFDAYISYFYVRAIFLFHQSLGRNHSRGENFHGVIFLCLAADGVPHTVGIGIGQANVRLTALRSEGVVPVS